MGNLCSALAFAWLASVSASPRGARGARAQVKPRNRSAKGDDEICPWRRARRNLQAIFQAQSSEIDQRQQKMRRVLESETDELVRNLCCLGWSGDGTGTGANDNGLCWSSGEFARYARCCFPRLKELAQAPAPPWMLREIRSDRRGNGNDDPRPRPARDADRLEEDWGHLYCRFRVLGGELHTCNPWQMEVLKHDLSTSGEPWGQYKAMSRALRLLLALDLLPEDLDLFVSMNIYDQDPLPMPVLTKARYVFTQNLLRVPSYELIGPLLDQIRQDLVPIPWDEKEPQLFWRGGMRSFNRCTCRGRHDRFATWPAHWRNFTELLEDGGGSAGSEPPAPCGCIRHITNGSTLELCNRVRLCELSRQHPQLVDAKLAYIPESYETIRARAEERGYVAQYTQPSAQMRYKYLISTDGSTIDDTRIYWMLSTGSLVFKQITPLLGFGITALEPMVHFVPIKEDLSDLVEKLHWARAHDEICRQMAARARDFARSYFTEEQILHYILRVIQRS